MAKPLITLYTPGNRKDLIAKAGKFKPDGIVIDLEDAVPIQLKAQTRTEVGELIPTLDIMSLVRVNSEPQYLQKDLEAVVSKHLYAVCLPMAETVDQIVTTDKIMTWLERERGIEPDSVKLLLLIETALGVRNCYDMCVAAKRVESVVFGSAQDGDLQRDLRSDFSIEGPEIMYARQKTLLDARAAKLPYVLDGAFSDIKNEETLRRDCTLSKRLGYNGRTLIYPGQVAVARECYAPDPKEVAHYQAVVKAFEDAEKQGLAAINYGGKLIDYAMYKKARSFLEII
jgi:citrate lyase subunit beta/citryl-CoA lyase